MRRLALLHVRLPIQDLYRVTAEVVEVHLAKRVGSKALTKIC